MTILSFTLRYYTLYLLISADFKPKMVAILFLIFQPDKPDQDVKCNLADLDSAHPNYPNHTLKTILLKNALTLFIRPLFQKMLLTNMISHMVDLLLLLPHLMARKQQVK